MLKTVRKLEIEDNFLDFMKIIFNSRRLNTFSLRLGIRQEAHSHHYDST